MKKFFITFIAALTAATAWSQDPAFELTEGAYEQKKVFTADSVSADALYLRALESLSDWAGSQERTTANIDIQDKEGAMIVYKGLLYLGYVKANFLYGWDVLANFTLKVRCKDGRSQVAVTVPSFTYHWTAGNEPDFSVPLRLLTPTYNYKGSYKIKKASNTTLPTLPGAIERLVDVIGSRIIATPDDDF